jgi:D-alanyl-D-alanine carboxypeptidase
MMGGRAAPEPTGHFAALDYNAVCAADGRRGSVVLQRTSLAVTLLLAAVFASLSQPALAHAERHAALVIDANTGAVLHNEDGDAIRHPASLTKMMTLYLTFEALESGRLKPTDMVPISKHAASQAPSKLGLKPGDAISVSDAIKSLITKSANDMAVALAEKVGGTEANFVRLMNTRARQMGMTKTHFENPSGLPNPDHVSTARDMITLALHLQDDYPAYYHLFSTRVFKYRGKSYRNHNTMLNTFKGMDGIKTGYTRASGFNIVTSVWRGRRHVIGAVFGGRTAAKRNREMQALLTKALTRASSKKTRKPHPLLIATSRSRTKVAAHTAASAHATAKTRLPDPGPILRAMAKSQPQPRSKVAETPVHVFKVRPEPIVMKVSETNDTEDTGSVAAFPTEEGDASDAEVANAPTTGQPVLAAKLSRSFAESRGQTEPSGVMRGLPPSTLGAQARALSGSAGNNGADPQVPPISRALSGGDYEVQIGAFGSATEARSALANAQDRAGGLLAGLQSTTPTTVKDGQTMFRARFTGLNADRASSTCTELRRRSIDCFVIAGE